MDGAVVGMPIGKADERSLCSRWASTADGQQHPRSPREAQFAPTWPCSLDAIPIQLWVTMQYRHSRG